MNEEKTINNKQSDGEFTFGIAAELALVDGRVMFWTPTAQFAAWGRWARDRAVMNKEVIGGAGPDTWRTRGVTLHSQGPTPRGITLNQDLYELHRHLLCAPHGIELFQVQNCQIKSFFT